MVGRIALAVYLGFVSITLLFGLTAVPVWFMGVLAGVAAVAMPSGH